MENSDLTAKEANEKPWILNVIGILFFLGLAWWSYSKITKFEEVGGYLSLPKPIKLFYDLMGKWGVVGFWLAFVVYNLIKGIAVISRTK
jgi:Na+-driven multidrug efflux pump